jgi:hypothetical protein
LALFFAFLDAAFLTAFFGLATAFRTLLDFLDAEDLRARAPPDGRPAGSPAPSPSPSAPVRPASPMSDMADPPASSSSGIPIPLSNSSCICAS